MKQLGLVAALALLVSSGVAFAEGDVTKGAKVFKKCKACHSVGEKAKNKVGPKLNGIVGADWGQVEGYKYSKPLLAGKAEAKVWDEATLDAYLTKPRKSSLKGRWHLLVYVKKNSVRMLLHTFHSSTLTALRNNQILENLRFGVAVMRPFFVSDARNLTTAGALLCRAGLIT